MNLATLAADLNTQMTAATTFALADLLPLFAMLLAASVGLSLRNAVMTQGAAALLNSGFLVNATLGIGAAYLLLGGGLPDLMPPDLGFGGAGRAAVWLGNLGPSYTCR